MHFDRAQPLGDVAGVGESGVEHGRSLALAFEHDRRTRRRGRVRRVCCRMRHRDRGDGVARQITDLRGQPIATPRHSFNIGLAVRPIAQRLAQRVDVLREITFFDKGVRPQRLHQLSLRHDPMLITGEQHEQVECLRWNRDRLPGAFEAAQRDVEAIGTKFIGRCSGLEPDPAVRERRPQLGS